MRGSRVDEVKLARGGRVVKFPYECGIVVTV